MYLSTLADLFEGIEDGIFAAREPSGAIVRLQLPLGRLHESLDECLRLLPATPAAAFRRGDRFAAIDLSTDESVASDPTTATLFKSLVLTRVTSHDARNDLRQELQRLLSMPAMPNPSRNGDAMTAALLANHINTLDRITLRERILAPRVDVRSGGV